MFQLVSNLCSGEQHFWLCSRATFETEQKILAPGVQKMNFYGGLNKLRFFMYYGIMADSDIFSPCIVNIVMILFFEKQIVLRDSTIKYKHVRDILKCLACDPHSNSSHLLMYLKNRLKIYILKKVNKCLSTSGPCHHTMAWSSMRKITQPK
jgi:hypothetical protein